MRGNRTPACRSRFLTVNERQPVVIQSFGGCPPGIRHSAGCISQRKVRQDLFAWIGLGALAQRVQRTDRFVVEISTRDWRIGLALRAKEPPDIAAVLEQQRDRFVFGMALKEYEQAAALFDECI